MAIGEENEEYEKDEDDLGKKEFDLVNKYFKSDKKTNIWFASPNSLLGGKKPNEYFYPLYRRQKLNRLIAMLLEVNAA